MVFIDTSALYAVLDRDDENHSTAANIWQTLITSSVDLVTHNYVLVETAALTQHRLGMAALRALHERLVPMLRIHWIQEGQHRMAVEMALAADRRKLSIVDCLSFVIMREHHVFDAFCFDSHFSEQGFQLIRPHDNG